jgi:hypothetical protein
VNSGTDADLRERFRDLREHDGVAAPAFASVLTRASAPMRRGRSRLAWTAAGFAMAAVAGVFLILRPPDAGLDFAVVALPPWPTQTDSLMASVSDSSQFLTWSPSPTSMLGQPSFNRYQESR